MRNLVGVIGAIENALGVLMWVLTVREYSKGPVSGVVTWLVIFLSMMVGLVAIFFFLIHRRNNIPSLLFAVSLLGGVASLWIGLRSLPFFNPVILFHPLYASPILNCGIALYSLYRAQRPSVASAKAAVGPL